MSTDERTKGGIRLRLEGPGKGEGKLEMGEECRRVVEEEPREWRAISEEVARRGAKERREVERRGARGRRETSGEAERPGGKV